MDVRSGYKLTEVGVIPMDWEVAPLSREVERLEAGVSVNSIEDELSGYAHEQAVLKTSSISGGAFLPHESKKIAPRDIGRARLSPQSDSIIISRMNTPELVGECGYVSTDHPNLFLPDRLWMTRNRSGSDVCVRWLNYLLSSRPYKARIQGLATGTSGSMKNIAKEALLAIPVAYPPSDEQRAIAAALSDVDMLLGGLDRLIVKKRDLKQAAMQQLLTARTRLPGFRGEWEMKRLGEVTSLIPGGVYGEEKPRDSLLAFRVATTAHIEMNDTWNNKEMNTRYFTREQVARYSPMEGDLIVVKSSGSAASIQSGKIGFVDEGKVGQFLFSNFLMLLRPIDILPRFLYFHLCSHSVKKLLPTLVEASTYPNIRISEYLALDVPVPFLSEQAAIAAVLSDMNAELSALEARRDKTRALKQGMMQELLTGRTRLMPTGVTDA